MKKIFMNDMMNFNEALKKNITFDNIKSHQRSRLHPLSRKHNFGKTKGGRGSPSLFRVKDISSAKAYHDINRILCVKRVLTGCN